MPSSFFYSLWYDLASGRTHNLLVSGQTQSRESPLASRSVLLFRLCLISSSMGICCVKTVQLLLRIDMCTSVRTHNTPDTGKCPLLPMRAVVHSALVGSLLTYSLFLIVQLSLSPRLQCYMVLCRPKEIGKAHLKTSVETPSWPHDRPR